jgi:hypothetical protein
MQVFGKTFITAIVLLAPLAILQGRGFANGATASTPGVGLPDPNLELLGSRSYSSILSPQNFQAKDIHLVKNRPIAEGMPIGATALKDLSPESAIAAAGVRVDLNTLPLSELKFLKQTSLESVVAANPDIANLTARSVGWVERGDNTLGSLASLDAGKQPLPDSVLTSATIGRFGKIAQTPYSKYAEAATQPVANFLGAGDIPLSKLSSISSVAGVGTVIDRIKLDRVATREFATGIASRISSGSNKQPHAPCTEAANNCNTLEIQGRSKGVAGSLWMVNQKLQGGSGLVGSMATAAGIREYAGYEIPGTDFKLVALSADARTGTARLRLDMRVNSTFGSTPFFLPLMSLTVSEKQRDVPFPVAVVPVTSTMAKSNAVGSSSVPIGSSNSQPVSNSLGEQSPATNVSQPTTVELPIDNANVRNGNIGQAVKTNAINPAIGGLQWTKPIY